MRMIPETELSDSTFSTDTITQAIDNAIENPTVINHALVWEDLVQVKSSAIEFDLATTDLEIVRVSLELFEERIRAAHTRGVPFDQRALFLCRALPENMPEEGLASHELKHLGVLQREGIQKHFQVIIQVLRLTDEDQTRHIAVLINPKSHPEIKSIFTPAIRLAAAVAPDHPDTEGADIPTAIEALKQLPAEELQKSWTNISKLLKLLTPLQFSEVVGYILFKSGKIGLRKLMD